MNTLASDDKGQAGPRAAIGLIIAVAVAAIIAAVLLPVAINAIEGTENTTLNQNTSEVYEVNGELESTVTDVTDGTDATVELNDTRTASTTSNTIAVGTTTDYSLEGGTVSVTVDEAGTDYAIVTYEYDKDYAYSDGASSVWGLLGLSLVLVLLLFLIRKATQYAP